MNNKKKIVLLVLFYLIGFVIQIIGFVLFKKSGSDASVVVQVSSALPIGAFMYTLSTMIPEKYKVLKYILYFYIAVILLAFLVLCIASIVTDFQFTTGGGLVFK